MMYGKQTNGAWEMLEYHASTRNNDMKRKSTISKCPWGNWQTREA